MSASRYMVLNRRCLLEHLGMALGSTHVPWARGLMAPVVGLSFAYRSGTSFACYSGTPFASCSGTPSPPFGCSSARVLRGGITVLGEGTTGARRHPTTQTSPYFVSEWSGHHQVRCRPVCEE